LVSLASIAAQTAKPIAEKLIKNTNSEVVKGVECGPQERKSEGVLELVQDEKQSWRR
jgi:hypothetical protein